MYVHLVFISSLKLMKIIKPTDFKYSIKNIFFHLLKTNGEQFLSNIEDSEAEVWFLCYRGLALTLQLTPNL